MSILRLSLVSSSSDSYACVVASLAARNHVSRSRRLAPS